MSVAHPPTVTRSFDPASCQHRLTVISCHTCGHGRGNEVWIDNARQLVLDPVRNKYDCAAFVSECPQCFTVSWVHYPLDAIANRHHLRWPAGWADAAREEAKRRLAKWPHLADHFPCLLLDEGFSGLSRSRRAG